MKISISVEGKTDTIYPDGHDGFNSVGETEVYVSGDPRKQLDVAGLLNQVASLVPNGTKLRVTVETIDG